MHPLSLCIFLLSASASAQSFTYELLELRESGGVQIAKETIAYGSDRTSRSRPEGPNSKVIRRELPLASGFSIGCSDYGEKQPSGFGCWLSRSRSPVSLDQYDGFSWEWYDRGMGTMYLKRQGQTKASLKTIPISTGYAMEQLEFLDETVFKVNVYPTAKPGTYTHELKVHSGSILLFNSREGG